jgi:hypothetical protein
MAKHDKVRARKRPLETVPILFVAQGGRDEPVEPAILSSSEMMA